MIVNASTVHSLASAKSFCEGLELERLLKEEKIII